MRGARILALVLALALCSAAAAHKRIAISIDQLLESSKLVFVGEIAKLETNNKATIRVRHCFRGFPGATITVQLHRGCQVGKSYVFFVRGRKGAWGSALWGMQLRVVGAKIERAGNARVYVRGEVPTSLAALAARARAQVPVKELSTSAFGRILLSVGDTTPLTAAERAAVQLGIADLAAREWRRREVAQRSLSTVRAAAVPLLHAALKSARDPEQRYRLSRAIAGHALIDAARPLARDATSLRRWGQHPDAELRAAITRRLEELR